MADLGREGMATTTGRTLAPRDAVAPTRSAPRSKGYRGIAMEGFIARWYARTRGTESQLAGCRREAAAWVEGLPRGARVLEVAPGPGYLAVEMARLGKVDVVALDISRTFVEMVAANARRAGVSLDVRQGDASELPFPDRSFDLVVCQAAFKNFSRPQAAVDEMYRVLRDGGEARIQDMDREASDVAIRSEVRSMGLGRSRAFLTARALRSLRRRAYTADQFRDFARASPFGNGRVEAQGIGLEVRLTKRPPPA